MEILPLLETRGFPQVIGVFIGSDREEARASVRELGVRFPNVLVPGGGEYLIRGIPSLVLVGPDGRISERRTHLHTIRNRPERDEAGNLEPDDTRDTEVLD